MHSLLLKQDLSQKTLNDVGLNYSNELHFWKDAQNKTLKKSGRGILWLT